MWTYAKGKYGITLNEIVSIEGQLGLITRIKSDYGIVTNGGYLKAGKDFDKYNPYTLLGYGGLYLYDEVTDDQPESGLSNGVGIKFFGGKYFTFTLEYLHRFDKAVDNRNLIFDTLGLSFT